MGSNGDGLVSPIQMLEIMWEMDHAIQARSKRMRRTIGVTGPQRIVLCKLDASGPLASHAIAQALHLHPSTLTGILQRLEARGFISRKRDTADSRRMLISLTPEGRKLARRVPGSIEQIVSDVFSQSTEQEIVHAAIVLRRMCAALE